jgi:hypothetical protein
MRFILASVRPAGEVHRSPKHVNLSAPGQESERREKIENIPQGAAEADGGIKVDRMLIRSNIAD